MLKAGNRIQKQVKTLSTYPEPVITSNNSDAENMLFIIKKLQPLSAGSGRKPRLDINFPKTTNLKISPHNASADKWLVLLWLIKPPY